MAGDGPPKLSRHAQRRREQAKDWCCKYCIHPISQNQWWNRSDTVSCTKCGSAKAVAFMCVRPPPGPSTKRAKPPAANSGSGSAAVPPWVNDKLEALAKELASTKAKLAETTSKQHAPSMEVDEGAEHCEGQGDSLDQKRARLEEVDAALRAIAGSSEVLFETARVELEDTRKKLSAELAAAKPVPAQLRTLSFKLGKLEQKRAKQEEALQAAKDKVVQANKEVDEATQQLAESDAAILELQQEQTRLAATLPRPPAGGVSPKADIVEGLGVTIEKLGAMLAELGDSGVLAEKLGTVLGEVREYEQRKVEAAAQEAKAAAEARATQAKAEPVPSQGAKESEAGPDLPDPDTATEEELREFLSSSGVDPSQECEELRGQVRKITDALGGWREVKRAKVLSAA
jgi:chromosome segregation ATPase